jgi:anti-sigma factor RsiW
MAVGMNDPHLSDGDLERYVSGMMHHDAEVAWVEKHLYGCPECADRLTTIQDHIDDPDGGSLETSEPDLYGGGGPKQ